MEIIINIPLGIIVIFFAVVVYEIIFRWLFGKRGKSKKIDTKLWTPPSIKKVPWLPSPVSASERITKMFGDEKPYKLYDIIKDVNSGAIFGLYDKSSVDIHNSCHINRDGSIDTGYRLATNKEITNELKSLNRLWLDTSYNKQKEIDVWKAVIITTAKAGCNLAWKEGFHTDLSTYNEYLPLISRHIVDLKITNPALNSLGVEFIYQQHIEGKKK